MKSKIKKLMVVFLMVIFLVPVVVSAQSLHVVQGGEWLSTIALQYGVDWRAIFAANPQVKNPNLIYPGQVLVIPVAVSEPAPQQVDLSEINKQAKEILQRAEEAKRLAEVSADQAEINANKSQRILTALTEILNNPPKSQAQPESMSFEQKKDEYNSDITVGGSAQSWNNKEGDLEFNFNNVFRGSFSQAPYLPGKIKYTPWKLSISDVMSIDPVLIGLVDYNIRLNSASAIGNINPKISLGLNIDIKYNNFFMAIDIFGPTLDAKRKWPHSYDSQTLDLLAGYRFSNSFSSSFVATYYWNELGVVDWKYLLNWYSNSYCFRAGFGQRYNEGVRQFEVMVYASKLFNFNFFKQLR